MDKRLAPVQFSVSPTFAAPAADKPRAFSGTAYGGGIITDHPAFERVAFDVATTKVVTPSPALLQHDTKSRAGVITQAEFANDIRIAGHLLSNPAGAEVAADADQGMPWQMSVRIRPGKVEEIKQGAKVTLNGQTFDGPLTVFRNNVVREVSFCALGADDSTSAEVFTIGGERRTKFTREESEMDQAEHDRLLAAAVAAKDTQIATLQASIATLQALFSAQRKAAVIEMFAGRKFKDDAEREAAVKPYLAMDQETFAAISADLKALKPTKQVDSRLFQAQATDGADDTNDVSKSPLVIDAQKRFAAK